MPGQRFHLAIAKMIADNRQIDFNDEIIVGTLVVDSLTDITGMRRCAHFAGGAGCVFPKLEKLRNLEKIQTWDCAVEDEKLGGERADPTVFDTVTKHIPESNYKMGIRIHLLTDCIYDLFLEENIFDTRLQKEKGIIVNRSNGEYMNEQEFRKRLYNTYPLIEHYVLKKAGITARDIDQTKKLISKTLKPKQSNFIIQYLDFDAKISWQDTEFFTKRNIDEMVEDMLHLSEFYIDNLL